MTIILCGYVKRSTLYKWDGLQLATTFAYYSWEMRLNSGFEVSFDSKQDYKGLWKIAGEVNSMKAYIMNDETSH
jgi:hypothetical protein